MKYSKEDILKKLSERNDNYDYSLLEYNTVCKKVKIICNNHGIFEQELRRHLNGSSCPKCVSDRKKLTKEKVIEQFNIKHNYQYDYSLVKYINDSEKIDILCKIHGIFNQKVNNHKNGQGCPKCKETNLNNKIFIDKSNEIHLNFFKYDKTEYINNYTKVVITCPHHGDFLQKPHNHLTLKQKCPKCTSNERIMGLDIFIKKSNIVHNNKYDYSLSSYTRIIDKTKIICPHHGEFEQKIQNHLNGKGCPSCKESKGEKIIRNFLEKENIKFTTQKTFKDCKHNSYLKFDYFLPQLNICIEYDGIQHFEPIDFFGGEKALIENKKRDSIKENFCTENNIYLIRISYLEKRNIFNILNKKILKL
jgi:Zn finger protein HypA/HybF involved in hydrogenase expression